MAAVKMNINLLQILHLVCSRLPRLPHRLIRLHFRFYPCCYLQAQSVADYTSSGRTGVPQADEWVVSILRDGYFLPLEPEPPLAGNQPNISYSSTHSLFQEIERQIDSLLSKQEMEEVPNPALGFYSRIFLAPKKSGDWRPDH